MGHYSISKVNIMNTPLVISVVWFVHYPISKVNIMNTSLNTAYSRNIILNTTLDYTL